MFLALSALSLPLSKTSDLSLGFFLSHVKMQGLLFAYTLKEVKKMTTDLFCLTCDYLK